MTDPPMIGDVGLAARRFGVPLLVISQDVFPEIATKLGGSRTLLVGALRQLIALYLRRADRIVAIGETMRRRLEAKGAPRERIRVIPNWIDTAAICRSRATTSGRARKGSRRSSSSCTRATSGHAQDLDVLVRATTFLRDLDDLQVVIVGAAPATRT